MTRSISQELAAFALAVQQGHADDAARRMRVYALDTLAVTLAGSTSPSSAVMQRAVLAAAGKPEATVMAAGRVTSAWDAALINGAFAHALELDDDHRIAVLHPGAVVVPAALAAAEAAGASGLTFLRALLVGYEVACRLGEVYRGSLFDNALHPTALCGVFGAAAAAAVCLDLDEDAFVRALGIAGTQASGLTEWRADGSWIKRLHPGRSAHAGVLSARLACEGFTGPASIFEGDGGFFRAFTHGEAIDVDAMTRGLGHDFRALGTAIKPYPCCRFEHGAIDLALEAVKNGVAPDDIASIAIRIYHTNVLSYHTEPKNPVDAQFNVPFAVAVAFTNKAVRLADFTQRGISDPAVLRLAGRIEVTEDDEFTAIYPQQYNVQMALDFRNGQTVTLHSGCPSGDPEAERYRQDPAAFAREVDDKVVALLGECGFAERTDDLRAYVDDLVSTPTIVPLADVLGQPRKIASHP
jgi:2-methylcitrate dehydratase PrpD